jgi:transposase
MSEDKEKFQLHSWKVGALPIVNHFLDRLALLTELVLHMVQSFEVDLQQLHNDSTSLTLQGAYRKADGQPMRGKPTVRAARGYSKDHRPDLKQLLWILTVSSDGGFRFTSR